MRVRRLLEAVEDFVTNPGRGAFIYQCRACGNAFETPQSECPDCGDEVDELAVEPSPPTVGPMG
jgi:uncharacterized OB-fold protein